MLIICPLASATLCQSIYFYSTIVVGFHAATATYLIVFLAQSTEVNFKRQDRDLISNIVDKFERLLITFFAKIYEII